MTNVLYLGLSFFFSTQTYQIFFNIEQLMHLGVSWDCRRQFRMSVTLTYFAPTF